MSDAARSGTAQEMPLGADSIGALAEALRGPIITPGTRTMTRPG
jgi:hypothetical protein